ncbi:MAG: cation-translocating P-type ATPase [Oligoflexales bacterium]|nr:cation-translocating P-type ATPase [Oligoflexales bacterium]
MSNNKKKWYALKLDEVTSELGSNPADGISAIEGDLRLAKDGPNILREGKNRSPLRILIDQITSTLVVILIISAIVSLFMGKVNDALAILAIVILNAILGFTQEHRAEKAMAALKKMATPLAKVRRDGRMQELPADRLVRGDIVALEAGSIVPADGRLLESASLKVQEAILTGESQPVEKLVAPLDGSGSDVALGDQRNMVFMGTAVTYGRGLFVVTGTGMETQLGKVASLLQEVPQNQTPLQRRLNGLGKLLAFAALVMFILMILLGWVIGEDPQLIIMTGISMAVAVVPEGLPAVATIALALGAQRMLARRALIRKLPAVETLGSVSVICSDKTGTLTENRMTVTALDIAGHHITFEEITSIRQRLQVPMPHATPSDDAMQPSMQILLSSGALCNDAQLIESPEQPGTLKAIGDPTEGALVISAAGVNLSKAMLDRAMPRIGEIPFDSDRKRMTTVHDLADQESYLRFFPGLPTARRISVTKGAVDSLLPICNQVWDNGKAVTMEAAWQERISNAAAGMAKKGMRVLGVALKPLAGGENPVIDEGLESDTIFVGMFGMIDPPRVEVKAAVETCRKAGIRAIMITGDHPLTARQIAMELGIATNGNVVTGSELSGLSQSRLIETVRKTSVFARVSPEHKLKLVSALQSSGEVVAMTGDGVNDAPALKAADIGVAMGITGTDVSKAASDMVLLDDNFATIVAAVDEGRTIYANILKFIKFSLAGNLAKAIVVIFAPLLGMPLPFSPFQILWMNLITDGLLGLGISVDPPDHDNMEKPPIAAGEGIITRNFGLNILFLGTVIGSISLILGYHEFQSRNSAWQSMVMTTLVFGQILEAFMVRSASRSLFLSSPFNNRPLVAITLLVLLMQMAIIYLRPLHGLFGISEIQPGDLLPIGAALAVILAGSEISKAAIRWRQRKSGVWR